MPDCAEEIALELLSQIVYRFNDVFDIINENKWFDELESKYNDLNTSDCFSLMAPSLKYIMFFAVHNTKPSSTFVVLVTHMISIEELRNQPHILDQLWNLVRRYSDTHEYLISNLVLFKYCSTFDIKITKKMLKEMDVYLKNDVSSFILNYVEFTYPKNVDDILTTSECFRSSLNNFHGVNHHLISKSFDLITEFGVFESIDLHKHDIKKFFLFVQILILPLYKTGFGIEFLISFAELALSIDPIYALSFFQIVKIQLEDIISGNLMLRSVTGKSFSDTITHDPENNIHNLIFQFVVQLPGTDKDKWRVEKLSDLMVALSSYSNVVNRSQDIKENEMEYLSKFVADVFKVVTDLIPRVEETSTGSAYNSKKV
ncbi:hypothetical protein RF11_12919 [Thelohanellus kitauei]|uniref:Uncharacterized protein n=1 Tax=Thelohanellus kitauei TaxID=669202 RepID=A0A0C2I8E9_THEKT|nr:hypothetical protein RF11_12919 [Thelohanellus kitauei]